TDGTLFCGECAGGIHMPVPTGVLAAMRHICYCDLKRIFSFSLPDEGMKMLSDITETYLLAQTDKEFTALKFYKSLFEI
ncbi:MAG: DNA repair protein RecO, partial [Clostridia bacterium]|nr:DNA repair protein RecO [Clostridia bacterium]